VTDRLASKTDDEQPNPATGGVVEQRGFTLVIALLVMALLTVLGMSLLLSTETERTMAANFTGTIQASAAAEAVAEAMASSLLFDLSADKENGWANEYLVVCQFADVDDCDARYGFKPDAVPCYDADPAKSCTVQDTDGTITGSSGQWLMVVNWRPAGETWPAFPDHMPVRIHPDLKEVLTWWKKFEVNPDDPDALNTGSAEIALLSICASDCTNAGNETWDKEQIYIIGIGQAARIVGGRIIATDNPATRAISIRLKGTLHGIWSNALVGGFGDPSNNDRIIEGKYLIRGGVMMFNDIATKKVLDFTADGTGVVNNYYSDEVLNGTDAPPIDTWWWRDAASCSTDYCDANNTPSGLAATDSDSSPATATVESLFHHLPDPPDQDDSDDKPGGYHPASTSNYPGPESLDAAVRVAAGKVEMGPSSKAGLGRTEGSGSPGNFWDNLVSFFLPDLGVSYTSVSKQDVQFRNDGQGWDEHEKNGTFDPETADLDFPKLGDPYTEPVTREVYDTYQEFLHTTTPATKPGGWALDLSDIDGTTGVTREVDHPDLNSADCWPLTNFPSTDTLKDAFGGNNDPHPPTRVLSTHPACLYHIDNALTTCGDTFSACSSGDTFCDVVLTQHSGTCTDPDGFGPLPAAPPTVPIRIYRRVIHDPSSPTSDTYDAFPDRLNLDTSSSIDIPSGRAQSTMYNSFAYKMYVDILAAVDGCSAASSTLWQNNMANIPSVFKQTIPGVYADPGATECRHPDDTSQNRPCFGERSAYMDVHIQLPDLQENRNTPPFDPTSGHSPPDWDTGVGQYPIEGRWLSVRFRPTGAAAGTMTVLSDPRARVTNPGAGPGTGQPGCEFKVYTDIAAEVTEGGGGGGSVRSWADPNGNSTPEFGGISWQLLGQPAAYDRAKPLHGDDTQFRNMPTGAFIVGLHLPCTTDLDSGSNKLNPYKCNRDGPSPSSPDPSYEPPNDAYEGYYTHLLGWAPKYTCMRTSSVTWSDGTLETPGIGPPHEAPTGSCVIGGCTATSEHSWFAETLWMANTTTLWNNPPNQYEKGSKDGPAWLDPRTGSMLGFKLNMPSPAVDAFNNSGPCFIGYDRRAQREACDVIPSPIQQTCDLKFDGTSCNTPPWFGNNRECANAGCAGQHPSISLDPERDCFDNADDDGDGLNGASISSRDWDCICYSEPDQVQGGTAYGGCTEIFTPLTTRRVSELNPNDLTTPFGRNATTMVNANDFSAACSGPLCGSCFYQGVDPDMLASWTIPGDFYNSSPPNRYSRDWPGWSSANFLMGAGEVMTDGEIAFGSPIRDCANPDSCDTDGDFTNGVTGYTGASADTCYNCGNPHDVDGKGFGYRRGYWSDPIVYDGRLLLYSGDLNDASTGPGNSQVHFNDHVVPRYKLGCADFLSVLSTGDTEVRMTMPWDAGASKRHLLAAFSLSAGTLKLTSADSAVQHELVGSWVANDADFGSIFTSPAQLIGTPTVFGEGCDHFYLIGRDKVAEGDTLSYVEDETLPFGY